ncbi:arylamine N-acetyltransferase family protein [Streptomyces violens]|uniref:arylamine N-acetyltransferase family protein n=1 Tax=Streptomyces violens TaxID=66377 RepID=UPI000998B446|nr:arylamine N-acetyltransferase [Streptomyces violens]
MDTETARHAEAARRTEAAATVQRDGGAAGAGAAAGAEAVDAYLRRIGGERPAVPDVETLRRLHLQHLRTVPFENLSIHLGEEIVLTEQALLDKVVRDRRGGFCYELNGSFAFLLTALGYDAELLSGRVYGEDGRLGIPYDHAAVRVRTPDGPLLADVGFGRHSHYPLRLDTAEEQAEPGGVFRVVETAEGDLDVLRDGAPQYRLELRPRALADFEAGCWWQTTSPKSHFTQSLVCSRLTEDGGRITLSGRTLVITAPDGSRREREIPEAEVLAAYRTHFGMTLDRAPTPPSPPISPTEPAEGSAPG